LDSIQGDLRDSQLEYQELEGDNSSLNQMNEIKSNELSKVKFELNSQREKNIKLKEFQKNLKQKEEKNQREKKGNEEEILGLFKEIEGLKKKNGEDERILKEFEFETQRNESSNFQTQKSNKNVGVFVIKS